MFPVSGAEQLKTSEAHCNWPMISANGAYSRLVSRVPGSSGRRPGRNMFHKPSERARGLSSSTTVGGLRPAAASRRQRVLAGTT